MDIYMIVKKRRKNKFIYYYKITAICMNHLSHNSLWNDC